VGSGPTRVTPLIDNLHISVIGRDTGQLIRELTLDPIRDYQPRGVPPWPPPAPYAAHPQLPPITAQQQRPQPESGWPQATRRAAVLAPARTLPPSPIGDSNDPAATLLLLTC
jgi:hypothetical protein